MRWRCEGKSATQDGTCHFVSTAGFNALGTRSVNAFIGLGRDGRSSRA